MGSLEKCPFMILNVHILFYAYFILLLLFKYNCLHFPTTTFPSPTYPHPPTLNPSPLWLCPWFLYTWSLMTLSLLSLLIPFPLPLVTVVCSLFQYYIYYWYRKIIIMQYKIHLFSFTQIYLLWKKYFDCPNCFALGCIRSQAIVSQQLIGKGRDALPFGRL